MSTDFKRSPTLPGNLTLFLIFYSSQQFSYLISPKLLPSFSLSVLLTPPVWWPLSSSSNRWDSCYQRPSLQLNSVPQSPLPFLGFCPAINLFLLHHQFLPLSWTIPSAYKLALVYTVLKTKLPLPHIPSSGTPHTPHFSSLLHSRISWMSCLYLLLCLFTFCPQPTPAGFLFLSLHGLFRVISDHYVGQNFSLTWPLCSIHHG